MGIWVSSLSPQSEKGFAKRPDATPVRFGAFILDHTRALLTYKNQPVVLGSRSMSVLVALVGAAGAMVTKERLLDSAWPDTFVGDSNLRVQVAALRKTLAGLDGSLPYVITVPGRGYRLGVETRTEHHASLTEFELDKQLLHFGSFSFDRFRRRLYEGEREVRLGGRALAILASLLEEPGRLRSRAELVHTAWSEEGTAEANIRVHLAAIRKSLRDPARSRSLIANEPGRGYRFVGTVTHRTRGAGS